MSTARKWLVVLGACAATFAATSIYLWRELAEERAQPPDLPAATVAPPPAPDTRAAVNVFSPSLESTRATRASSPTPANPVNPNVDPDEYQKAQSQALLAQLADPVKRARLLEESRANIRSTYPWVAERLKLSPAEYERFVDLQARTNLEVREAYARCTIDPDCNLRDVSKQNYEAQSGPLQDLLGPERMKQFEIYQQSLTERETVLNLRAHLPDQAYLSSELTESLITALAEESQQAQSEAAVAGHSLAGFGMSDGWIYYQQQGTPEQQMQSAEAYVKRMTARAAQVLSGEQLRYFTEMQQNLLANLRGQVEKSVQ